MKRKLFLLLCALLTMIGVQAADLPASGSGEYFIKNVETGTFLKGDMYWGTKACVWDDPYLLTLTYVSEGVYTIQSQQNNGGQNQYITSGEDPYVDGPAANMTFTEVDGVNHYFTINNGNGNLTAVSQTEDGAQLYKVMATSETSAPAQWQVLSKAELIAALDVASASNPVVATFFMKDPGFDVKSVNAGSWTKSNVDLDGGGNAGHSAESWNKANFNISQTVTGLPNGKYRVECYGYYRWNNGTNNNNQAAVAGHASGDEVLNAKLFAGTKEIPLMSVAGDAEAMAFCQTMGWPDDTPNQQWQAAACFDKGYYKNTLEDVVVTDGTLTLGVKKTTQAGTDWAVFDEFKLFYLGEDLSIYVEAYHSAQTAANAVNQSAPMNAATLTALQTVIANYGTGVDETNKDALLTATSALNAAASAATNSIAAYAAANAAITKAEAMETANNFVTSDAATTFAEAIAAIKTPYTNGTLSDADANTAGTDLGVVAVAWHAAATNTPASRYLGSTWPSGITINDWSVEGETDGSNYLVPFFQNWTNDGNSLSATTMTGTLTGLPVGTYKVSAWVRVRAKNGTNASDATGITMDVNGGTPVDVTEGTQVGTTPFQMKEYEATGYVLDDGDLTVNFNIANSNNISWLSYQNISYTRTGDVPAADADDYAALADAISAVSGYVAGFEDGEYAPYNNVEAFAALAVAQAINPSATNLKTVVQAATTALNNATWTANVGEQNAIYNGDFALSNNDGAQVGWQTDHSAGLGGALHSRAFVLTSGMTNYDNLAAFGQGDATRSCSYFRFDGTNSSRTTKYTYGATEGYTMPLKTGTIYKLTAQAGGWGQVDKNFQIAVVSSTDENVNLKTLATGVHAGGPVIDYEMYFVVPAAGDYKLVLNNPNDVDNAIVISNIVLKSTEALVFADDAAMPTYAPGTYPSVKITRTLTAGKWATAVYPFAVTGVDNIAVLDSYNSGTGEISFATAAASTANEPFLMRSTAGTAEISLSNVAVAATVAEPEVTKSVASLKGVYASDNVPVSDEYNVRYVVSSNQLYKVDGEVSIKPFRAYFELTGESEARPVLRFDDATGINTIEAAEAEDGALKDGKYLIGNKVVLVKNGVKYGANGQKLN